MEIGTRIKQRRESLNMSQEELAFKVGYKSRSSINKIESDGRGLPQSKIVAFANALETTPAYLMGWEKEIDASITSASITLFNVHCESKSEADLVLAYRKLSDISKRKVSSYTNNLLEIEKADHELKAAHERTDIEVTDEMRQYDDDIMNDPDF